MSDMKDLYKVYSAVHSSEIKDEITNARDGFSEMNLSQITDSDLQDIAEEIIEGMFGNGFSVDDSISIIKNIFSESLKADQSNFRISKIDRISEGFDSAFSKVLEKSSRVAIESFAQYRKGKQLTEKWSDRVSHDVGNERIHAALIAEDRMVIVSNLLKMIEDFQPLPKEKMERQADKAYDKERGAAASGDEKETNKQMQRRIAIKDPKSRRQELLNKEGLEFSEAEKSRIEEIVSSWED
jgi:hypothetical protein